MSTTIAAALGFFTGGICLAVGCLVGWAIERRSRGFHVGIDRPAGFLERREDWGDQPHRGPR